VLWEHLKPGGTYIIEDWIIGYWFLDDRKRYAHGEGMVDCVLDIIKNKKKLGIGDFELILKEPACSLAILKKL
jgi:hypothetical protein